ncbi:MAG: NADH-quinone oxidoreductase subunit [Actinomycetota bacterium]|jgi:NADH-quinone oxidoreductase subunit N|nr:NADH-quinone oxidoreductase subunit [Actinomycetota bacterium]
MPLNLPAVQLGGIGPEIALTVTALVALVAEAMVGDKISRWYLPVIATAGLVVAGVLAIAAWNTSKVQLAGAIANDDFAVFVKVALAIFGLLTVWVAREYLEREGIEESEFYALVLLAVAGMMLMAGAADLIVMFLALETFSIALYVLVGSRRRSLDGQESAMKYFLLGAFSSAFFLLGIALAYGAAGTTNLYSSPGGVQGIAGFLSTHASSNLGLLSMAAVLLIVGLGFKIAAVPFHMWTPDAYQGAPSPVTGFMAAATKIAAFAAILRLFDAILYPLRWDWRPLVIGIAIITMIAGSIAAIVQEDVKRMLAYSSIAHAGFVLTGVIAANDQGVSGALFYLVTYGITVLGAFAVVAMLSGRDEQRVRLTDYRGLFYDHPLLAGSLTLFLLSLGGVPITAGFVGKVLVFGAAVQAGYAWVSVIGVLASSVAMFFYLRVMVVMYMQESEDAQAALPMGSLAGGVIALCAVATIFFGLAWGPLFEVAQKATFFAGG